MNALTKALYKISKLPQRQMRQSERGEAMFAPTNTASMNAPTPSKVKDSHDE